MHRYEILPIIRLADILFHLLANTDTRSNYKFLHASCNFSVYFLKFCLIFLWKYCQIVELTSSIAY